MSDYKDQLNHPLWIEKRNKICERDNRTCQHCGTNFEKSKDSLDNFFGDTQWRTTKRGYEIREKRISLDELKQLGESDVNFSNLQVHHHYYVKGKMAWEYPDRALITLCGACHEKVHNNQIIKSYRTQAAADREYHKIATSKIKTEQNIKNQKIAEHIKYYQEQSKKNQGCMLSLLFIIAFIVINWTL